MPRSSMRPIPAAGPDFLSRSYWSGSIKMSLSKYFILCVLHEKPMHGYDITRAVERTTSGCCSPSEGTIYPVLREFEEGGFVSVEAEVVSGRTRKVYSLTDKGREAFQVALAAWMDVTQALMDSRKLAAPGWEASSCCP